MNKQQEIMEYKTITNDEIYFYDEIDSTNEEAKRLIKAGKLNGGVIITEFQTAGKGTQGRKWVSKSGNSILMTIVQSTEKDITEIQGITVDIGNVVYNILSNYLPGHNVSIKLPNDILVNKKKICGILTESIKYNNRLYLIIGIGINVNTESFELIEGNVPTSLYIETGIIQSRKEIALKIICDIRDGSSCPLL